MPSTCSTTLTVYSESIVRETLTSHREVVLNIVEDAYLLHHTKQTVCPQSVFLSFPDSSGRGIGLPAMLLPSRPPGGPLSESALGIKWIASVPHNIDAGLPRASATIVLNCPTTGRAYAIMEATHISSHRTAASAAIAAKALGAKQDVLGIIGCGPISLETLRYMQVAFAGSRSCYVLHDSNPRRATAFAEILRHEFQGDVSVVPSWQAVVSDAHTIVIATSTPTPYMSSVQFCDGATVLHLSLRDITSTDIALHRNIVDDVAHICRENTSVHVAVRERGASGIIAGTLGDVLTHSMSPRVTSQQAVIFHPFGLGVLDIAVASWLTTSGQIPASALQTPSFYASERSVL